MRSLSALNRGQDSKQQSHIDHRSDQYRFAFGPILVDVVTTIGSLIDHYWFALQTNSGLHPSLILPRVCSAVSR